MIAASNDSGQVASGSLSNDATLKITFTLSEATSNFSQADVALIGGTLSAFVGVSDTVYTAVFTPISDGDATIRVNADVFTDLSGNGNTASNSYEWTYDGTAPVVSFAVANENNFALNDSVTTNDAYLFFTVSISENVTDFDETDFTLTGGMITSFSKISNLTYTFTFTPVSDGETSVILPLLRLPIQLETATNPRYDLIGPTTARTNDEHYRYEWKRRKRA